MTNSIKRPGWQNYAAKIRTEKKFCHSLPPNFFAREQTISEKYNALP